MFKDNSAESKPSLLQKVFRVGGSDFKQQGTDLTATIDVTGRTGKHIFYFVANGEGNASSLANINAGATTEADFLERLSDVQSGLLKTPLLMTARKEINDVENVQAGDLQVKLTRRVARFDIINDATQTNFTVEKIIIENVNLQGYVFGGATGSPKPTLATGTLPLIDYAAEANANTATPIESLFYIYPTEMGADKLVISFEGTFMGEGRIYSLKSEQTIEANKRYVLSVKTIEANKPNLEISAVDWADDGGEHTAVPETDKMIVGTATVIGAGTILSGNICDATNATATATLKIPVKTYNFSGTRVDVTYLYGTGDGTEKVTVTSPEPILTYAAGYLQEHQISIPVQKTLLHTRIEIVNNAQPEERDTFYIKSIPAYVSTKEKPVLVGGVYWAPVNVGASEVGITTDVKHHGLLYQWGRNIGFTYAAGTGTITDTIQGPLDLVTATTGTAKDKFINGSKTTYSWLTDLRDDLWSGDNRQGPCPDGWRVPTLDELTAITTIYKNEGYSETGRIKWDINNKRLEIKSDDGKDILYLPVTGNRNRVNGVANNQGLEGNLWAASSVLSLNMFGYNLSFSSAKVTTNITPSAFAFSVRCVLD
ncbi:uncharacterized protein (TIGR02145 family) [Parabacteroides sp. PF5-5]|uniref:hypothetical protein n=1 Tax=unclassified Parabacteroides TaxID=2649774 RepID=UPI00247BF0FF|nr:uncharacterized protein (TIGR02145 family) [Parabacteroides sp. PH5-39]MDH6315649.1 uncharacterized protein (TIGR02145 family) [Parabacteroides sp. PF5-13]MDH6319310.1 uncharacterized protein (TIGR02145 family) [Parabacteroides sp. PH5-13]MDH6323041.1 uncharacterized protein (TIGR02145 family) [Parabacteroides sp. PH5-8]MDH6326842.1 uncharacterized protein (TIGR02145 family) [Parabacteroides sp. PH5-41]MDH6334729.1 uncharacterized protein (TIGR02145 family) [Parabacteroides sp. PF5-5]MDH63